ncbi:unnamed protein product, partial [Porites evermanni]
MSYQTSSKRSPPFWLLTGQKNTKVFWHQSASRTAVTVWNWSAEPVSSSYCTHLTVMATLLNRFYFKSAHGVMSKRFFIKTIRQKSLMVLATGPVTQGRTKREQLLSVPFNKWLENLVGEDLTLKLHCSKKGNLKSTTSNEEENRQVHRS